MQYSSRLAAMNDVIDNNHSELPHITVIGGGTGSNTLLTELKNFTPNITALVNMSDDGGSTGRLRKEYGVLPPGDVRQCLAALSNAPEIRDLFSYRFGEGELAGHSIGNLVLSALELQHEDFEKAIKLAGSILRITGKVVPVTLDKHTLVMVDGDEVIYGEYAIGHTNITSKTPAIRMEPRAGINPEVKGAIQSTDMLVIAPGNLYGSLLPALAVEGMSDVINESEAKKVMVANLVTKPGQTDGWHVVDYVKAVERYTGAGSIDTVLYNTALPPEELLAKYAYEGEFPVSIEEDRFLEIDAHPVGLDLLSEVLHQQDGNDTAIKRTLIRHNAKRVGAELMSICCE